MVCYLVYSDLQSKFTKLEENFSGFMNGSLVRFDFEKSPLHTIVYGATGTGKTFFIKQYSKLYQNGEAWSETHQEQDNKDTVEQDIKDMVVPNKSKSKS